MIESTVEIVNRLGLHARAAAKLVECSDKFGSRIQLCKDTTFIDAKSIMSVMMLAAGKGTRLRVTIEGEDEQEAYEALAALIADRFGEPD